MKVKVIEVKDKSDNHITAGHGALNKEGEAYFRVDNKLYIIPDAVGKESLLTSTIQKITVETKNSIYELEVVQ